MVPRGRNQAIDTRIYNLRHLERSRSFVERRKTRFRSRCVDLHGQWFNGVHAVIGLSSVGLYIGQDVSVIGIVEFT